VQLITIPADLGKRIFEIEEELAAQEILGANRLIF
jgi:hypothetical protein